MKPKLALTILTGHNKWRRGGNGAATDPVLLGQAIDVACEVLKRSVDKQPSVGLSCAMKSEKNPHAQALGRMKSTAKSNAARANGRKGGRPRKTA